MEADKKRDELLEKLGNLLLETTPLYQLTQEYTFYSMEALERDIEMLENKLKSQQEQS